MGIKLKELFDEQGEIMAWLVFLAALGDLIVREANAWGVVLFALSLVTMGVLQIKHAGPGGVEFRND